MPADKQRAAERRGENGSHILIFKISPDPMTPAQKALWIRRLFTLALIGGAAAAGLFFSMPGGWRKDPAGKKPPLDRELTREKLAALQATPGKLTITNMMLDGDPNPARLKEILETLQKRKYGDKVVLAELDVAAQPELATAQGVDLEKFASQLDFHSEGRKLGQLIGETDPAIVERTIDRMLAGNLQRFDKNWLPEVPGMQRDHGQPVIEVERAPAKP